MTPGRVLHGEASCGHILKLVGSIRYTMREDMSAFLEQFFTAGRSDQLIIDMTETTEIDSTGLGLVAKAARKAREVGAPAPRIVSSQPDITLLLASMGLEQVFEIVPELPCAPGSLLELPMSTHTPPEMAGVVIEAHRSLMDLNERNREIFAQLVAMLQAEVDKAQPEKQKKP